MTPAEPLARDAPGGRKLSWVSAAAVGACLAVMLWMGLGWDALLRRENYVGKKPDYYSHLVHGFVAGHLYMDVKADPRLGSPDPAVRDSADYLLDASYFKGHYYLYFGATPAVLVLLPYAWLTGADLEPRVVVVLCTMVGFLFSIGILRMATRGHLGRPGACFQVALVVILAFATATPLLLTRAMFYELPIAAGYSCTMAGAFWIYRSLLGRGARCLNLSLASLSMGLAVGCRPELVFSVPLLACAAFLAASRDRGTSRWPRSLVQAGAAALVPAALVGACLALYNYERFGSPLDFGISYSSNDFVWSHHRLASFTYLWPNVHWYYLTFPALSPFFPYVFPEEAYFGPPGYVWGEAIHGQFPVFALAAFVAISSVYLRGRPGIARLGTFLGFLGWMFLGAFLPLCFMGVRADRYMVDFQPALALGVVLLAAAVATARGGSAPSRLWRGAFVLLAAAAAAFNLFAGLEEFSAMKNIRSGTFRSMELIGNYPSYWLEKTGMLRTGPIELKVVFPENVKAASVEPILTVGTPESTDSLYVAEWPPGGRIMLSGDHHGFGGPSSQAMTVTPGQVYTLKVDMGAFYPPLNHPYFARFKTRQAHTIKSSIRVEMDGKTVLDQKMGSYDAPPWTLESGRNDVTLNPYKTVFSGHVLSARRLAPPEPVAVEANNGLWRIRCVFPMDHPSSNHPLLSAGVTGNGTLVYLNVLPENKIRIGLDEWGAGGSSSDAIDVKPDGEHLIEIYLGPLASKVKWPTRWGLSTGQLDRHGHDLRVWLDGRPVWTTELHLALDSTDSLIDVGTNLQGFSTAPPEYLGQIRSESFSDSEAEEFVRRNTGTNP